MDGCIYPIATVADFCFGRCYQPLPRCTHSFRDELVEISVGYVFLSVYRACSVKLDGNPRLTLRVYYGV